MRLDKIICLLLFALSAHPVVAADDVLHPDEAMVPSVKVTDNRIEVTLDVAEDVYLYRHALDLIGEDISLDGVDDAIPAGEKKQDPYFGEVETYRNQLQVSVPFSEVGQQPRITVKYQGCVDSGICYPPQKKTFDLSDQLQAFNTQKTAPGNGLLTLGQSNQGFFPGGPAFVSMDDAFQFEAIAGDANTLLARFTMAPNMYLYLDQLQFSSETDGVRVGQPSYSETVEKDDPEFGRVQVFYDLAEIELPLIHTQQGINRITLRADYQGCEDGKICYPPAEKIITVDLPGGAVISDAAPQSAQASVPALSEQQRLTQDIGADAKWWTVLKFFGFGLLLALTPCVFPMIPILSSLIVGQNIQSTSKAFLLSLVYVLAMALTYTVVGVVAGVLGANLQAIFQKPWILISFSLVFVLLALSMFGFYDLQLPAKWQNKLSNISNQQKSGSWLGVAVMGLLSALIVGPCVAPPLAAAVIYISTAQNGAVMGGLALFAMSMGMGVPLLLIGATAGKWMPQAGGWMNVVKSFFGIALLGMAIWFMGRILPDSVVLLLWGLLLVAGGIMWHQHAKDNGVSGWVMSLFDALKIILLVIGVAQIIGAMAGQKDPLRPLQGLLAGSGSAVNQTRQLEFETIKSLAELQDRLATTNQPVYFDFYADWCIECKRMERTTFQNPEIVKLGQQLTLLKADVTANDAVDQALMKHFGVFGPPASLFFDAEGRPLSQYNFFGFKDAAALKQTFEKILK